MPHCYVLKTIHSYHFSTFLRAVAVISLNFLPIYPWLSSNGNYSLTIPTAPSLKPIILTSSLIRCEPVQVGHHHPLFLGLYSGCLFLLLLQRRPTPPHCPPSLTHFSQPDGKRTTPFTTYSLRVCLTVLLNTPFLLRHSSCFRPWCIIHCWLPAAFVIFSWQFIL